MILGNKGRENVNEVRRAAVLDIRENVGEIEFTQGVECDADFEARGSMLSNAHAFHGLNRNEKTPTPNVMPLKLRDPMLLCWTVTLNHKGFSATALFLY